MTKLSPAAIKALELLVDRYELVHIYFFYEQAALHHPVLLQDGDVAVLIERLVASGYIEDLFSK